MVGQGRGHLALGTLVVGGPSCLASLLLFLPLCDRAGHASACRLVRGASPHADALGLNALLLLGLLGAAGRGTKHSCVAI